MVESRKSASYIDLDLGLKYKIKDIALADEGQDELVHDAIIKSISGNADASGSERDAALCGKAKIVSKWDLQACAGKMAN